MSMTKADKMQIVWDMIKNSHHTTEGNLGCMSCDFYQPLKEELGDNYNFYYVYVFALENLLEVLGVNVEALAQSYGFTRSEFRRSIPDMCLSTKEFLSRVENCLPEEP